MNALSRSEAYGCSSAETRPDKKKIKRKPTNSVLVDLGFIFISFLIGFKRPKLLLVGHDLDVVGRGSESERLSVPIAYLDLVYIDLDATILAGNAVIAAATAFTGILILLDLQVICGKSRRCRLPGISIGQSPIISDIQSVDVCILIFREPEGRSSGLKYPTILFQGYPRRRCWPCPAP